MSCFEPRVSGSAWVGCMGTFLWSELLLGSIVRFEFWDLARVERFWAYHIFVVKCVLKLNKGTKHWRLRAFISIAARVRWALESLGPRWVSWFGLRGWAWWLVQLLEGCSFFWFTCTLALRASPGSV